MILAAVLRLEFICGEAGLAVAVPNPVVEGTAAAGAGILRGVA